MATQPKSVDRTLSAEDRVNAEDIASNSATVTNTDLTAGAETVQLYSCALVASVTRPVQALKASNTCPCSPMNRSVTFQFDCRHLAFCDRVMQYMVEPEEIEVTVGSSSRDIRLRGQFVMQGKSTVVQQVIFAQAPTN